MESVEHGTGDQRRLVSDPEMLDRIVGIDVDDALGKLLDTESWPNIVTLTLLPSRVWKTGPYLATHFCATLA